MREKKGRDKNSERERESEIRKWDEKKVTRKMRGK